MSPASPEPALPGHFRGEEFVDPEHSRRSDDEMELHQPPALYSEADLKHEQEIERRMIAEREAEQACFPYACPVSRTCDVSRIAVMRADSCACRQVRWRKHAFTFTHVQPTANQEQNARRDKILELERDRDKEKEEERGRRLSAEKRRAQFLEGRDRLASPAGWQVWRQDGRKVHEGAGWEAAALSSRSPASAAKAGSEDEREDANKEEAQDGYKTPVDGGSSTNANDSWLTERMKALSSLRAQLDLSNRSMSASPKDGSGTEHDTHALARSQHTHMSETHVSKITWRGRNEGGDAKRVVEKTDRSPTGILKGNVPCVSVSVPGLNTHSFRGNTGTLLQGNTDTLLRCE